MSEEKKEPLAPAEPDAPAEQPEARSPVSEDRPLTRGQQRRRQRSVFQYITILFAAAFVLLLFTFMMERRQNELLQQENQEQIDNLQQSVSAVQRLEDLYNQNAALREQIAALEDQLADSEADRQLLDENNEILGQTQAELRKALNAMDWFWQIDEAYVRGRYSLCRDLIQSLQAEGLVLYLPKESITDNERFSPYDRYQEIYAAVY